MPFGVVRGVGRGMGVLDESGDRRRGRGSFRGEFGAPIVTNGGLCDALFSNYFEDLYLGNPTDAVGKSDWFAMFVILQVIRPICHSQSSTLLNSNPFAVMQCSPAI